MRSLAADPLPGTNLSVCHSEPYSGAPPRRSHFTRLNGVEYQYPVCFVCNRDVEAFTWCDHPSRATGESFRTFFVACHGDVEVVSLKLDGMRSGQMKGFRIEYAFAPPALDTAHREDADDLDARRTLTA